MDLYRTWQVIQKLEYSNWKKFRETSWRKGRYVTVICGDLVDENREHISSLSINANWIECTFD